MYRTLIQPAIHFQKRPLLTVNERPAWVAYMAICRRKDLMQVLRHILASAWDRLLAGAVAGLYASLLET